MNDARLSELLKNGAEIAQKGTEVAQKGAEVAQKGTEVAQRLTGKGRADAINNAVVVFNALQEDGSLTLEKLEALTKLSNLRKHPTGPRRSLKNLRHLQNSLMVRSRTQSGYFALMVLLSVKVRIVAADGRCLYE